MHFLMNWGRMSAAQKNSPLFKAFMGYTSDAIFKMLAWAKRPNEQTGEPGLTEVDRVRGHMVLLGLSDERIKHAPRRYWRRMARYHCPEPAVIIRGLFDVYCFFRQLEDPDRPGHSFFSSDAESIFLNEIRYVQRGELLDVPGLNYYTQIRVSKRTNFVFFRGKRGSSAEEGYHMHLRAAQHPSAKGQGPRLELARTELFDFAFNVGALVRANLLPDAGHFHLWLNNALHDVCKGVFEGDDAPPALRNYPRLDTSLDPVTWRGVNWSGLEMLRNQGALSSPLSSLRSTDEIQRVLQHPNLLLQNDVAGIARATGVLTTERKLAELVARVTKQAVVRQVLEAHGVQALRERVRVTDGGTAPCHLELPAPLTLATRADTRGGPLPLAVTAMVAIEQPAPLPVAAPAAAPAADANAGAGGGGQEPQRQPQQQRRRQPTAPRPPPRTAAQRKADQRKRNAEAGRKEAYPSGHRKRQKKQQRARAAAGAELFDEEGEEAGEEAVEAEDEAAAAEDEEGSWVVGAAAALGRMWGV